MKVIGLTGGIGMGKSTAAACLQEELGCDVVDTDVLARQVVEPGQPALEEIRQEWGDEMIDEHGRLRRDRLAQLVFGDRDKRRRLESMTHPRIRALWMARVEQWRSGSASESSQAGVDGTGVGVVVIPLLYETGAAEAFDAVVCVACSGVEQERRLSLRGWEVGQIRRRVAAQWPVDRKIDLAEFVVWSEGARGLYRRQLSRILQTLS